MASTPVADPQHPVSDTQIDTLSMYWKSSNKATTPTYVPMNLGAGAGAIDFLAILGHNLPSGTTITLEHDDNADFSSPTSIPITYYATNIFQFFTAFTEQWVRLKLVKAGGWTTAPQVAATICGSYFEPNCNFDWKYVEGDVDPSKIDYSDSMVVFAQEKEEIFRGEYLFASLDDTAIVSVQELITLCGIHKAFVICFDSDNANTQSLWVRLLEISQPQAVFHNIWSWNCPIEEIK
jgi:hypothetical protein